MKKQTILILSMAVLIFAACKNEAPDGAAADSTTLAEATPMPSGDLSLSTLGGTDQLSLSPKVETSVIEWVGSTPTGSQHSGTIKLTGGAFNVIRGNLKRGTFDIDMNSLAVTDLQGQDKADLEGHLKNADFFEVEKFPKGMFEITGVKLPEADQTDVTHIVTGSLTLKGVSKPITFPANITVKGGLVNITTPEFTINRTDWGIKYKSGLMGTVKDELINDDVKLKLKIEAPVTEG